MSEDDFELNYINTLTKYERAKAMLSMLSITLIISILFDVWNGIFHFFSRAYLSEYTDDLSSEMREALIYVSLILLTVVMLIGIYVMYRFMKNYVEIAKERNFMNVIKELRRQCD